MAQWILIFVGVTTAYLDLMETAADGDLESTDSSFIKIIGTEVTQRITEAMQEIAGPLAAVKQSVPCEGRQVDFSAMPLQARRLSIMSGTNEIQRALIALRVLQLPRGRARA